MPLTTMVPHSTQIAAMVLALRLGAAATANFSDVASPGLMAGVGADGRLLELGWLKARCWGVGGWGCMPARCPVETQRPPAR